MNNNTKFAGMPFKPTLPLSKRAFAYLIRVSAAAVCIAVFLAGTCFAANTPSGRAYFKQYYIDKAKDDPKHDYSFMNTEQIGGMASSTVGTVLDSAALKIEVLGAIFSGNTAEIILRVTAKKLHSVLYDNGLSPQLPNFRFREDSDGSLFSNKERSSVGYCYSDKDKSLAANQFKIFYTVIGQDNFEKEQYSIELSNFGFFTCGDGTNTDFVTIYNGNWQVSIAADPALDESKNKIDSRGVTIGGYRFPLVNITVTPLACTIRFKCNSDNRYLKEHLHEIFKTFSDRIRDTSVTLSDGKVLSGGQLETSNSSGGVEYFTAVLTFFAPVKVENIVSIKLLGLEYSLRE
ncbi:MAG: hypothetical protein Q8878_02385 [Bacillota bacterium]|nr:hypothetical protein [Bacillota bacterium]